MEPSNVSEPYVTALWDEIGAWSDLRQALREQRTAIVHRQIEAVWASQDRLQELLRQVATLQGRGRQLRPPEPDPAIRDLELQVSTLRREVRDVLRLNHELLRDICSYLEMMREVVFPQTLPPTYRHPRERSRSTRGASPSLSRTA
jgi:hypothetical protein